MSDELKIGISKPSFYKEHQNLIDLEWNVYETNPIITPSLEFSTIVDAYGVDFEIENIPLMRFR